MRVTEGVLAVASSLGVAFAVSEGLHWRETRRFLPNASDRSTGPGDDVLLVLGFPSRTSGPHPMQKWRTDIAIRSMERSSDFLVLSGGSRKKGRCEADAMAAYARDQHQMRPDRLVLEREARSTWQNVEYSLPHLENARTIKMASSPLHAARSRAYLAVQRPALAGRLRPADDFRFGERPGWKALTVAYYGALLLRQSVSRRLNRLVDLATGEKRRPGGRGRTTSVESWTPT